MTKSRARDTAGRENRTGILAQLTGTASAGAFVLRAAWRVAPNLLLGLIAANLILAGTPAAQVILVGWLVRDAERGMFSYMLPLTLLVVVVGVGQLIGTVTQMNQQRMRDRVRRGLQDDLLHSLADMPPSVLSRSETAGLVGASRESLGLFGMMVGSAIAIPSALLAAALLCITVGRYNLLAGVLVVLALIPPLVVRAATAKVQSRLYLGYGQAEHRARYAVDQLVGQRSGTELASLGSAKVVAEIADRERGAADAILDRIITAVIRGDVIGGLATSILLGGALAAVLSGGHGEGGVAAGIVGVLSGMQATQRVGFAIGDTISGAPKVSGFRRLLAMSEESRPTATDPSSASTLTTPPLLRLSEARIRYGATRQPAIDDVSIEAHPGEMIALVGANGAGKSTAINGILGLRELEAGSATLNGREVVQVPTLDRLAAFGVLTQEFGRYEFTVRDSLRLGRPDGRASDEELWTALENAHVADAVRELPDGLDSQLGEQFDGVGLSGGQWQRLALARIFLRGSTTWVLDEPTSAVDAETEQQIFSELADTKHSRTTIVVSHRAWTLRAMDRIYVLDKGRVVQQGRFEDLVSSPGRFKELFTDQIS